MCFFNIFVNTNIGDSKHNTSISDRSDGSGINIKINKEYLALEVGKTATLEMSEKKKDVKWSSSKKTVATVSTKGKVTAKKAGTATIIAKVSNKKYYCKVTVFETKFKVDNEMIELENVSILPQKVDIYIPKSFSIMSEEMAKIKYPSEERPTIIYTNESGSINIGLKIAKSNTTDSQIKDYTDVIKKSYKNLYPSAQWFDSGVKKVDGKNVGYLELLTPAIDTEIYNLIYLTELDGKLLLLTFNCTKEKMNDWKPIAKNIMASLQFK